MDVQAHQLPIPELRRYKLEATQRLLGDTIQISDADWEGPSRLPGWTRAHVAAHLARNAEAYKGLVEGVVNGHPASMYADDEQRTWAIERSSEQTPLHLQIDLDTTANALAEAFDDLSDDQWDNPVEFDNQSYPVAFIVLSRLSEIVLHHVDLDCGFEITQVDDDVAGWLLRWCMQRLTDVPPEQSYEVEAPDGERTLFGPPSADAPTVSGSAAGLVGWLSGRGSDASITVSGDIGPQPLI
jgi:maleylpyruvate isomerase